MSSLVKKPSHDEGAIGIVSENNYVSIPVGTDLNDEFLDPPAREENSILEEIKKAKIDLFKPLETLPVCLEIQNGNRRVPVCTLGNFSAVIGKAKAKKSFFLSLVIQATLMNSTGSGLIAACLSQKRSKVILIDTEQSDYHAGKAAKRGFELGGKPTAENFEPYKFRKYSSQERLKYIEWLVYNTPDLGFLIIDGVRDLLHDFNSIEQAQEVVGKLMKWSEEMNIHIMVVLHQNKGDVNARGHLGTEITNKAETLIAVSVHPNDPNTSIVEGTHCRNEGFESFAFSIDNESGMPFLLEEFEKPKSGKMKKTKVPEEISEEVHKRVLAAIFKEKDYQLYNELLTNIKNGFLKAKAGVGGDNKVRELIKYYVANNWISQPNQTGVKRNAYVLTTAC